jgi:hypothetical protein
MLQREDTDIPELAKIDVEFTSNCETLRHISRQADAYSYHLASPQQSLQKISKSNKIGSNQPK